MPAGPCGGGPGSCPAFVSRETRWAASGHTRSHRAGGGSLALCATCTLPTHAECPAIQERVEPGPQHVSRNNRASRASSGAGAAVSEVGRLSPREVPAPRAGGGTLCQAPPMLRLQVEGAGRAFPPARPAESPQGRSSRPGAFREVLPQLPMPLGSRRSAPRDQPSTARDSQACCASAAVSA